MDTRKDLYAFAMQGKEHSPDISERASEKIDAYRAAVLREAVAAGQELMADGEHESGAIVHRIEQMADEAGKPEAGA